MRGLTNQELEVELAEQLPARELMGCSCYSKCQPHHGGQQSGGQQTSQSQSANVGSGNGNGNGNTSGGNGIANVTISALNGNGNGSFNGNGVTVNQGQLA
jgi:hypothetical protein